MKINAHYSSRFQTVDEIIWHARLGHPSLRLVHHLHNKGAIRVSNKQPISFICNHYTLAKSSQMPFLSINKRSTLPFALVHVDL